MAGEDKETKPIAWTPPKGKSGKVPQPTSVPTATRGSTEPRPQVVATHPRKDPPAPSGSSLSPGLISPSDPKVLKVIATPDPKLGLDINVELYGLWDGKTLKGVMRAIEREYKLIRHKQTQLATRYNYDARKRAQSLELASELKGRR